MNSFGTNFRVSIFGESHGEAVGVVVDGVQAGLPVDVEMFESMLSRRRGGGVVGSTPRMECDVPRFLSGVFNGVATGAPLTVVFENSNVRSGDYADFAQHPRPSHSDFVAGVRFGGYNDVRGGGHFSGRLTVGLVAAGVVARASVMDFVGRGSVGLDASVISVDAAVTHVGGVSVDDGSGVDHIIARAAESADSLGGVVECRVRGLEVGVGEPFFDSLESVISHIMFAIPGVRGVEFGDGFAAAAMCGSEHNDVIVDADGHTATNHAGGVVGGLSNSNELVFRVAFKPAASIGRAQVTYDISKGEMCELVVGGRHDVCIALRGAVVVEAAVWMVLADLLRRKV